MHIVFFVFVVVVVVVVCVLLFRLDFSACFLKSTFESGRNTTVRAAILCAECVATV